MTREPFRTASADKFNTPVLADFGAAAQQYETDLAGALDVSAAARLQIGRLYFDGTEDAVPFDFFSHAKLRQLVRGSVTDRKSTRLNSSHSQISYAVFCLKKKKKTTSALYPCVQL